MGSSGQAVKCVTVLVIVLVASAAAYVPTGCVRIKNADKNRYLAADHPYDNTRRDLTLQNGGDALWNIISTGSGYRIQSREQNEDLYAAGDHYAYDNDRRRVFTWTPGGSVIQGYWDIEELGNKRYRIRNKNHNEYLYSANYPSENWVFTWRRKGTGSSQQFDWIIEGC